MCWWRGPSGSDSKGRVHVYALKEAIEIFCNKDVARSSSANMKHIPYRDYGSWQTFWFGMGEYGRMNKILKELYESYSTVHKKNKTLKVKKINKMRLVEYIETMSGVKVLYNLFPLGKFQEQSRLLQIEHMSIRRNGTK
ncbi:hypothetical protein L1987_19282 [Smallanthus sonchifolius]|uniref:Uncharacterized protein n=1 Tax=Smallanthus sonchifolius TaxID=185202 RepID=A0ACB9INV6_9ASTR|nr:hypothetical protein L1987_19282 [Smallanthus sonchifolius]